MKKKKVLLIHHSGLVGGAGGISLYNLWLSLQVEYEVVGYVPDDPPSFMKFLKGKGLSPPKIFDYRLGKMTYYSGGNSALAPPKFWYHTLHSLTQIKYWENVLESEKPDLVIVNSKVLCWMGFLFKKADIKSVCYVRETIRGNPSNIMNQIMRKMLDSYTAVTFLSEYDLRQTKLKQADMIVTPDYLEPSEYRDKIGRIEACQRLGIDPNSFNVLFAGGVNKLKGIDLAVESMNQLKNSDITLIVAGSDGGGKINGNRVDILQFVKHFGAIWFSKRITKKIDTYGIKSKIKFIGVQIDMSVAYSGCDLIIFPMKKPHQARPAFEVGVQKKIAVITDFPNIREYIKDGFNGIAVEPDNPTELAKAIVKAKNNRNWLKQLGENNYDYTIKYHTEKNAMAELIGKIRKMLIGAI